MSTILDTDYIPLNRGGAAGDGSSGSYHIVTASDLKTYAQAGGGGQALIIAQVSNTDVSTNINGGAWANVPINGSTDFLDSGFSIGTNGGIICNFSGRIKVTGHVGYTVSGARVNVKIRIAIAGVGDALEGKSGYVRNATGHNESSVDVSKYFSVTSGQEVTIQSRSEAAEITTTMDFGGSMLLIERIF